VTFYILIKYEQLGYCTNKIAKKEKFSLFKFNDFVSYFFCQIASFCDTNDVTELYQRNVVNSIQLMSSSILVQYSL
jgi:hypothetical protein